MMSINSEYSLSEGVLKKKKVRNVNLQGAQGLLLLSQVLKLSTPMLTDLLHNLS